MSLHSLPNEKRRQAAQKCEKKKKKQWQGKSAWDYNFARVKQQIYIISTTGRMTVQPDAEGTKEKEEISQNCFG
jgi:hypothetical protein